MQQQTSFNFASVNNRIDRAFNAMSIELSDNFTKAIEAPVYSWPRGESPRDIVDTHALAESQQQKKTGRLSMEYSWPREGDISLVIHEGAVLNNGTILPARRWTQVAMARNNPTEIFARKFFGEV